MDNAAILHSLTDIFHEVLDDDDLVLTPQTTADDVEGWDSMTHITIVVEAERRFGVKFGTAEIDELKNIDDFVNLIARKRGKPAA